MEKDSQDPWKFLLALSKTFILFLDAGLAKSFGVLLDEMILHYKTDHKTMAFICSLPATLMYLAGPFASAVMTIVRPRTLAITGGVMTALPLMLIFVTDSPYLLGTLLAVSGVGMGFVFLPVAHSLTEYFDKSYNLMTTLTLFGLTLGASIMPIITERSMEAYGLHGTFFILGGICLNAVPCGAVVKPRRDHPRHNEDSLSRHQSDESDHHIVETEQEKDIEEAESDSANDSELRLISSSDVDPGSDEQTHLINSNNQGPLWCSQSFDRFRNFVTSELICLTLVPSMFLIFSVMYAWMLFLVPHAEWLGIETSRAVFLSTIAGISGVFGRIVFLVFLYLEWDSTLIFLLACIICAMSFMMSSLSASYAFQAAMAVMQGFTLFVLDSLNAVLTKTTIKDDKNMNAAITLNVFVIGIGATVGDVLSGHVYDVVSSYTIMFMLFATALVIVIINLLVFVFIKRCRVTN